MARYSYNGTVLHEIPGTDTGEYQGNQLIYYDDAAGYYVLICSPQKFTLHGTSICLPADADVTAYATTASAHTWVPASWNVIDEGAKYTVMARSDQYVWTRFGIRSVEMDPETGELTDIGLGFAGSEPVWAAPDVPVGAFGWNSGGSTASLSQSPVTLPQMAKGSGWHSQLELHCITSVGDGGTIKTEWFRNGSLVQTNTAAGGSAHSVLKPSADAVGTFEYYARVTNTLNGASTSNTTPAITVTVVEYDLDNYDPETGDSSGTITPGVVAPGDAPGGDDPGSETGGWDKTSLLLGWLMGCRIAGQRKRAPAEKTLTGYSYNGVTLPALPDWPDYPYLLIKGMTVFGEMTYYVQGYQTKPVTVEFEPMFGDNYDVLTMPQEGLWKSSVQEDETKWYKPDAEPNEGTHSTTLSRIVWANFDIYTSTGELYLAASEPIPVYE